MLALRRFVFQPTLLIFAMAFANFTFADDIRIWTDATGKHTVKAEFVKMDGENVVLKREDGKVVELPLSKLNKFSQNQARIAADKSGSPAPTSSSTEPSAPRVPSSSTPASASASKTGVVDFPENASAKEFLDIVFGELQKKNYIVLWDALPTEYQNDVNQLTKLAGDKVDPAFFKQSKQLSTTIISLLRSKKKFVLGSKHMAMLGPNANVLAMCYDEIVNLAEASIAVDLMDPAMLKKGDMRFLAEKYFSNLVAKINALAGKFPPDNPINQQFMNPPPIEYTITKETPNDVSIQMIVPGNPNPTPDTQLVNVSGRWLPFPMVNQWERSMKDATIQLNNITPDKTKQMKMQFGMVAAMVNGQLAPLQAADTQADFDAAIDQLVEQAQQLAQMGQRGNNGFNPNGPNN